MGRFFKARGERGLSSPSRVLFRSSVALAQHSADFMARRERGARIGGEDVLLCSWPRGTAMGEILLLLSCGAAFIDDRRQRSVVRRGTRPWVKHSRNAEQR
jgi:hypothetical protein